MIKEGRDKSTANQEARIQELELRLREAEETMEAFRTGVVDAVVVYGPKGQQVFTLEGADTPYRAIIETMSEGAVTLSRNGHILYCNQRFSEMLGVPLEKLIGASFLPHVDRSHLEAFEALFESTRTGRAEGEIHLKGADGLSVPTYISGNGHAFLNGEAAACLMVTDIRELFRARQALQKSRGELETRVEERTAELKAEIVERGRIEETLRQSEERFRSVFEHSPR